MRFLRDLPSLKKIESLPDIGETPIAARFTAELVKAWGPIISAMSATYAIPRRLEAADLRQELLQHLWKLTKRVDPHTKPDDFNRLCKAEFRNKCIDLGRYAKARKRMARTGKAVQCQCCGSVTRLNLNAVKECKFCLEKDNIRIVDTYAKDVNYDYVMPMSGSLLATAFVDVMAQPPIDNMIEEELGGRVRRSLPDVDRRVYDLMTNPSDEFLAFLREMDYDGDHRHAPARIFAEFLHVSDRDIADAHIRIKIAVTHVCDGEVSVGDLNKVAMKRLNLS